MYIFTIDNYKDMGGVHIYCSPNLDNSFIFISTLTPDPPVENCSFGYSIYSCYCAALKSRILVVGSPRLEHFSINKTNYKDIEDNLTSKVGKTDPGFVYVYKFNDYSGGLIFFFK